MGIPDTPKTDSHWSPRPLKGKWTADQQRVASCFPAERRVVCVAANGVGKTFLAADLVVSFMIDRPHAVVILTAPTQRQVNELLWPEVTDRLISQGMKDAEWQIPTKPKYAGGDGDKLIGFATNTPMRLQGFHAADLLIVCDEASGMPGSLIDALIGIAVAERNYVLLIGNPNLCEGPFYQATRLPSWHFEQISALTHPNIIQRREVIPGATTWLSMLESIRDWCKLVESPGEDTFSLTLSDAQMEIGPDDTPRARFFLPNDSFRIRYLGRFPLASSYCLIPPQLIERARDRTLPYYDRRQAALDVARTGGDRTVYGVRRGDSLTRLRVIDAQDLMLQAEEISRLLNEDQVASLTVDAAGLGIGLIDFLRRITNVPIREFRGADEPLSPLAAKRYFNRRSQAYGNLATAFERGQISIPAEPDLVTELAAITFEHTEDGRLRIHPKDQIKQATGRSPDLADMVSMLWDIGASFAPPATPVTHREQATW